VGKTVLIKEIIHNVYASQNSNAVFTGIGERSREGQELYPEMKKSNLLDKMSMVYGQMGDNPVSRSKSVYAGLTLSEYLRDEKKQDVLLFIDNIYRFIQAKAEIATELKQILIGNGYPSDMASEMSKIEERINSNQNGSITSVQAIYIPADDLNDESVQTIMSYMDGQIVLDIVRPAPPLRDHLRDGPCRGRGRGRGRLRRALHHLLYECRLLQEDQPAVAAHERGTEAEGRRLHAAGRRDHERPRTAVLLRPLPGLQVPHRRLRVHEGLGPRRLRPDRPRVRGGGERRLHGDHEEVQGLHDLRLRERKGRQGRDVAV
ncbi:MAG: hypothetical protein IJH58_05610, partial [Clostridia bacterium]|nr:hypothetical protein [Clostridia bacterium]